MIGPHIIGGIGNYGSMIRRWQPRVALMLDPSEGAARTFKDWSPNTFLIGRVFKTDQEIEHRILSDARAAAQWAAGIVTMAAARNPEIDVWQFTNEIAQSDSTQITKLAEFSSEYIRLLADEGLRAAIGGFSVGRPEAPQNDNMAAWGAFLPAMREGVRREAVLLLHAYGAPHILDSDVNWFLHRYERVVLPHLPEDVRSLPYVYGEYGCDMGVKNPGDRRGWRTGYGGDISAYAADLRKAAEVLALQPQCLGACVFTLGHFAPWGDFDIAGPPADTVAAVSWPGPQIAPPVTPPTPTEEVDEEVVVEPVTPPQPKPEPVQPIPAIRRAGERIGIDANNPLSGHGPASRVANPALIADTGVGWVRLNFVRGPWDSVEDRGWEQTFRTIVSGFRSRGLRIYGLINCEAVNPVDFGNDLREPPQPNAHNEPHSWIDRYVDTFASIVRRFHNDVEVWESFNEPDDWHNGSGNWVEPGWFAIMLERIYNKVKFDLGLSDVRLVSGPVQGLTINNNAGANYLRLTYEAGKERYGWGKFGKPFPFDGVGYHLYVAEEHRTWEEQIKQVPRTYAHYMNGLKDVIKNAEGHRKPLFISEMGWHSNGNREEFQSQNLPLGLELMLKDRWVELAVWFCTQDFGPLNGDKYYGIFGPDSSIPFKRKAAYVALTTFCAREWTGLPKPSIVPKPKPEQPVAPPPKPKPEVEAKPIFEEVLRPAPFGITNQQVINAFNRASLQLGMGNWGLMSKAGLNLNKLVKNRHGDYQGAPLDVLGGLSDEDRFLIREALPDDVSFGFPVHDAFMAMWPDLTMMAMDFPKELHIHADSGDTVERRRVTATWNRFGYLLINIADILGLELSTTVAVLAAVFDQRGLDGDGRLNIRFEVNTFFDSWGREHTNVFVDHFSFGPTRPWQKHRWLDGTTGEWSDVHHTQDSEWAAFWLALGLDRDAALDAVAMGFPRLMGFNHAAVGYNSAEAMLDAFASSERFQVLAYFDLIAGPTADSRRLDALSQGDVHTFAALHYGPQSAARYATTLQNFITAFAELDPLA